MILTYPKGSSTFVSSNFRSSEFDCKCENRECVFTFLDEDLISLLQALRDKLGKPLIINSGYRCTAHQLTLKSTKGVSMHEQGRAADIVQPDLSGEELMRHAREVGFKSVGIAKLWCHVDTRQETREWRY